MNSMSPSNPSSTNENGLVKNARVRQACTRCRKQKLKCDFERPCTLCLRSAAECQESSQPPRKRSKTHNNRLPDASRAAQNRNHTAASHEIASPGRATRVLITPPLQDSDQRAAETSPEPIERLDASTMAPEERISTFGLADQLFQKYDAASGLLPDADALPGGTPDQVSSARGQEMLVPVSAVLGQNLPPAPVVNLLFDTFLDSVHWFMMVFHEPTLRIELDEIISSGYVQPRRLSLLILLLVIITTGAKYVTRDAIQKHCPGLDVAGLQARLMAKIEGKFLEVFDEGDIESVQVGILLSSVYIYHRQPKRGFVVLGAALKGAQALGLHRESSWGRLDPITREVRRRTWWAFYVCDGFAAITYGRPCTIHDGDWQVEMPRNIDDSSAACPGFKSLERLDDGSYEPVTTLSYQRFKFKLYHIASRITRNVYFNGGATLQDVIEKVKSINDRLIEWEKTIPAELRLRSFSADVIEYNDHSRLKMFHRQALALQLSYDNIQLILHRPLLAINAQPSPFSSESPISDNPNGQFVQGRTDDVLKTSRCRCWESAMRVSRIGDYPGILKAAQNTHAAGYAGIQAFTAGVMLAIFALSKPLSTQAQESKRAISRLIKMPKTLGYRTAISDQGGGILQELIRLILAEEMKSLIFDDCGRDGGGSSNTPSSIGAPLISQRLSTFSASPTTSNTYPRDPSPHPTYHPAANDNLGSTYRQHPHISIPHDVDENSAALVSSNIPYTVSDNWTLTGNFNDALNSLQSVFRDNKLHFEGGRNSKGTPLHSASDHSQGQDHGENALSHSSPGGYMMGGPFNGLNDAGQTWLWDDSFQFN